MSKNLVPVAKNASLAQRSPSRMLEDFFTDPWNFFRQPELATFKMDIKEDNNRYTIEAEMPGVKKEDISLDLDDGQLTIGVAAREAQEGEGEKLVHNERCSTYMERSIYLVDAADEGVDAKLENGELVITVPKRLGETKQTKIDIK